MSDSRQVKTKPVLSKGSIKTRQFKFAKAIRRLNDIDVAEIGDDEFNETIRVINRVTQDYHDCRMLEHKLEKTKRKPASVLESNSQLKVVLADDTIEAHNHDTV